MEETLATTAYHHFSNLKLDRRLTVGQKDRETITVTGQKVVGGVAVLTELVLMLEPGAKVELVGFDIADQVGANVPAAIEGGEQ